MAITNLTGQKTAKTFKNLMQISSSGEVFDGLGNLVTFLDLTSSFSSEATINTGSLVTTSSFNSYTGSTTSQFAGTSSFASTASFVRNAQTASYVLQAVSSSYAQTASYAVSSSFATNALTASYLSGYVSPFPYTGSALITGSLGVTGSVSIKGTEVVVITGATRGTTTTYTKLNYATTQDNIDTNMALKRGNNGGIYNPYYEPYYSPDSYPPSPLYTEWNSRFTDAVNYGFDNLVNAKSRTYSTWKLAVNNNAHWYLPTDQDTGQPLELIMHDLINDKYYSFTFTQWTQGGAGGGMVYDRELLNFTTQTTYTGNILDVKGSTLLTGSLNVSQGITGSLFGTGSYATTASYALNAGAGAGFPFSGSAVITGSLLVSGSGLTITGSLLTTGNVGIGVSPTNNLNVVNSATGPTSAENLAVILGNNTSTDVYYANSVGLYGKVATSNGKAVYGNSTNANGYGGYFEGKGYFSGNVGIATTSPNAKLDVNGNAIITGSLTVTNTLILDKTLTDYTSATEAGTAPLNLVQQATGSHTSAFLKYTLYNGTNARAGEFITVWNGSNIVSYDNSTTDIGNTSDVTFQSLIVTGQIQINAIPLSGGWKIKALATFI